VLETTWFIIWVLLWAVYFTLDGFDLGLGVLMPFLAKDRTDRNVIYNSVGPFWDGNEVWLITETETAGAKRAWDWMFALGSFLAALLLGVAFANIFAGIPIDADGVYHGSLLTLLNPYGLLGGALFLVFFLLHGCLWLAMKSEGELRDRAGALAKKLWAVLLVLAVLFLHATTYFTRIWDQYLNRPALFLIPLIAVASLVTTIVFIAKGGWARAWIASSLFIVSAVFFGLIGIYPALLPSSLDATYNVTIHNSASSSLTLKIMLGVVLVFVPLVIAYQAFVYHLFRGKAAGEEYGH